MALLFESLISLLLFYVIGVGVGWFFWGRK